MEPTALHRVETPLVQPERAAQYRASGWWDNRRLSDGIEAAALERPDATAVIDNEREVTHAELATLVASGVAQLSGRGVRPGSGAVLITGNTRAGVVAYHALLRVGATTVVLDRRCGVADVRHAAEVVGDDAAIVVGADRRDELTDGLSEATVLALESFGTAPADTAALDRPEPDRDGPTVVLFTSGTTSRPKGAIHSINTLTAGAANMAMVTGADDRTVVFLVSPLTSITGVMQMHLAADTHATLVLEDQFEPEATLDRINDVNASLLGGAPVIVEHLLRAVEGRADRRLALTTLALGGAMLPLPVLELAVDGYGIEVARVYGSSEAPNTTGSLPADDRDTRLADDGVLLPGTEVRVGSTEDPREGLVRGPAVFLGYVDEADNEVAFEADWYRTGDAVEVIDGRLTVLGRLKEVVNRNGLKISLAEVEGALVRLPGSVELACIGVADDETGERLAVAVRAEQGHEITLDDVVGHLRAEGLAVRKLPEEVIVWGEPLPRTASGKIIRSRVVRESAGKPSMVAPRLG